jgi:hypothetical protein
MAPTSGGLYTTKNLIYSSPYDAAGNMTALPPGMTYTYDAENRLTTESNTDGQEVRRTALSSFETQINVL